MNLNDNQINEIVENYLTALEWSSYDELQYLQEYLLLNDICIDVTLLEFSENAKELVKKEVIDFVNSCIDKNINLLDYDLSQVGHDLFLTSHGHGVGFWDRKEIYKNNADTLTELSKSARQFYIFSEDGASLEIE